MPSAARAFVVGALLLISVLATSAQRGGRPSSRPVEAPRYREQRYEHGRYNESGRHGTWTFESRTERLERDPEFIRDPIYISGGNSEKLAVTESDLILLGHMRPEWVLEVSVERFMSPGFSRLRGAFRKYNLRLRDGTYAIYVSESRMAMVHPGLYVRADGMTGLQALYHLSGARLEKRDLVVLSVFGREDASMAQDLPKLCARAGVEHAVITRKNRKALFKRYSGRTILLIAHHAEGQLYARGTKGPIQERRFSMVELEGLATKNNCSFLSLGCATATRGKGAGFMDAESGTQLLSRLELAFEQKTYFQFYGSLGTSNSPLVIDMSIVEHHMVRVSGGGRVGSEEVTITLRLPLATDTIPSPPMIVANPTGGWIQVAEEHSASDEDHSYMSDDGSTEMAHYSDIPWWWGIIRAVVYMLVVAIIALGPIVLLSSVVRGPIQENSVAGIFLALMHPVVMLLLGLFLGVYVIEWMGLIN